MKELKWGVIGFGSFADAAMGSAIASTPGHRLVAISGRDPVRIEHFAKKYGVRHFFTDPKKLAALGGSGTIDSPDAVYIATPNNFHCPHTLLAASRGLHVLCEKPMAVTLQEARRMTTTCEKHGVTLMIGNMMRFNPCHSWIKTVMEKGILGRISCANATFEFHLTDEFSLWRLDPDIGGGGAIMDVGVHCIDLLRYILAEEVTRVAAFIDTGAHPFPVDTSATVLLQFESGVRATVTVSFVNKHPKNSLEFRGTEGSLIARGTLWRESTGTVTVETERFTQTYEPAPGLPDPYVLQIEHFARCIAGETQPLVSGEEGLKDLAVCLAAYESHKKNAIVDTV
jgi:1,5-anhydro-D-fructose reductase (1,5-anhydro-D-mannitol-forming)